MLGTTFNYFKYIILIDEKTEGKSCKSIYNLLLLNYYLYDSSISENIIKYN